MKRVGKAGLTKKVCTGEDEGVSAREEPRDRRQGGEIYDKKWTERETRGLMNGRKRSVYKCNPPSLPLPRFNYQGAGVRTKKNSVWDALIRGKRET